MSHSHNHEHTHQHQHEHNHGKMPIILYIGGLVLALIALFLSEDIAPLRNSLFAIATIAAGYHVVILEGLGETIENTKHNHAFTPNAHILMGLAAIGAS